jgi:type IV pilus assembly protein PilC
MENHAVKGEQEAYSKEELEKALVKLGYQVESINKKLFDFKGGVPNEEIVTLSAFLPIS